MAVSASFCFVFIFCAIYLSDADRNHPRRQFNDSYLRRRHELYCGEAAFRCDSGQCIIEDKLCDGKEDCRDGSDETRECVNIVPCASKFLFQCDYGACINRKLACDGKQDCKDNSDESPSACENRCGKDRFQCNSGQCIYQYLMCDGKTDCNDSSDETNRLCSEIRCPAYTYRCQYGACVERSARCNGTQECEDGSDELGCGSGYYPTSSRPPTTPYRPSTTPYRPSTTPYNPSQGWYHCGRGTFMCNSGQCLTDGQICDGRGDCNDNSDESNGLCAQVQCASSYYRCAYGACVAKAARCNGITECVDNSDESGCPSLDKPTASHQPSTGSSNSCIMPVNPTNGIYGIGGTEQNTYKPFDVVPPYSVLMANCNQGYSRNPPDEIASICLNGTWMPSPGSCARPCPLITSSVSDIVECKFKNRPLKSCEHAVDGTVAIVPCAPLEANPGIIQSLTHVCKDGIWDKPVSQCLSGQHANDNNTVVNVFYIFNRDNFKQDSNEKGLPA